MPTPDFEEWLARQEIDLEHTTTAEKWHQYMIDQFGFTKGSLDVADAVYETKYEVLPKAEITPFERHYTIAGEKFVETRYAIKGMAGSFGAISAYSIAETRLTSIGETRLAEIAEARLKELMELPPTRRRVYE